MGRIEANEASKQAEAVWHAALTEDGLVNRFKSPDWRGDKRVGCAFEILGYHYLRLLVLKPGRFLTHPDSIARVGKLLTLEEQRLGLPLPDGIRYKVDQSSRTYPILWILGFVEYKTGTSGSNEQLSRYATLITKLKDEKRATKFMRDLLKVDIDVKVADKPKMFFVTPNDIGGNISPTNFPFPFIRIAFPQTIQELRDRIKKERKSVPNH